MFVSVGHVHIISIGKVNRIIDGEGTFRDKMMHADMYAIMSLGSRLSGINGIILIRYSSITPISFIRIETCTILVVVNTIRVMIRLNNKYDI